MHKSSYLRMEYLIKFYERYFANHKEKINILDIGSYGGNGTYKDIFKDSKYCYTGLDMIEGPNVDFVPKDIYNWSEIKNETFDLVISGQVFEHIEYPWLTIKEIERVLKPSGFAIIIAPNSGIEHKAPTDCYRYHADGFKALAKWANFKVHHVSVAGVPDIKETDYWMNDWNDVCLVVQKAPYDVVTGNPFPYEMRVPTYGYRDTYKLWKMAVMQACKKFDTEKPMALFGAGWIGKIVLKILGDKQVYCFVDNNKSKIGQQFEGKPIISFDDFEAVHNQYNCLITASYESSLEIKKKFEDKNLKCELLYIEN